MSAIVAGIVIYFAIGAAIATVCAKRAHDDDREPVEGVIETICLWPLVLLFAAFGYACALYLIIHERLAARRKAKR